MLIFFEPILYHSVDFMTSVILFIIMLNNIGLSEWLWRISDVISISCVDVSSSSLMPLKALVRSTKHIYVGLLYSMDFSYIWRTTEIASVVDLFVLHYFQFCWTIFLSIRLVFSCNIVFRSVMPCLCSSEFWVDHIFCKLVPWYSC